MTGVVLVVNGRKNSQIKQVSAGGIQSLCQQVFIECLLQTKYGLLSMLSHFIATYICDCSHLGMQMALSAVPGVSGSAQKSARSLLTRLGSLCLS